MLIGLALALLVLVLVGLTSFLSVDRFIGAYRASLREADVLVSLQQLSSALHREESAQRGYLLTGEARYLAQREEAAQRLRESLTRLQATGADPALRARVAEFDALVRVRQALLDRELDVRRHGGLAALQELMAEDTGNAAVGALDESVAELVLERHASLAQRAVAAEQRVAPVIRNFFLALSLVTLVVAALMTLILREMRRRRQALEELARGEARLHAVVGTAVDAIIVIDERGRIEDFNHAAERIFGYAAAEVVGCNVSMLMPSPYREEHDGYIERYRRTGEKRIIGVGREVLGRRKDGEVFPLDLSVSEFRVGAERRYTGIVRDISERKRVQARQAELVREVEAANEELRSFAYIASHDLKAPLRAIGSLADWISADYGDRFDEAGREQMGLLIGRVRRMDQLIDGILAYSRVGRVREERIEVELGPLLESVVDLLAPPPHIQVELGPLPTVVVEPTRIQQVFQNLLSNAIRYLDKPRGRIEVGAEKGEGEWRFFVRDNGPGIAPRHQERIFLLFQTLQPRDRSESTGIGLALVKKIVEMYGGEVGLESEVGEGSTFYFSLPGSAIGGERVRA